MNQTRLVPNYEVEIDYHDASHTYFADEEKVDSVNQFADSMLGKFDIPPRGKAKDDPTYYMRRGTLTHSACEIISFDLDYDIDELPLSGAGEDMAEEVRGFARGWKRFLEESEWQSFAVEEAIYSKELGIAGRPDAIGTFPGDCKDPKGSRLTVLDIKTGGHYPRYDFCSAAYLVIGSEYYGEEIFDRVYVYLKATGEYRIEYAKREADITAFLHAAAFKGWRDNFGK